MVVTTVIALTQPVRVLAPVRAARWEGGPLELKRRQLTGEVPLGQTKLAKAIRSWYTPSTVDFLKQAGFNWVWLTWSVGLDKRTEEEESSRTREYIRLCRQRGIRVMGVVSAGRLFLPLEVANTTRRTQKSPQGTPIPCQDVSLPTRPSVACYQANLDEQDWQNEVVTRSLEAVDAGADGVILEKISSSPDKRASVVNFVRSVSQKIQISRPAALVVPLLPIELLDDVPQSPWLAIDEGTLPQIRPTSVILEGGQVMIAGASQGPWIDQNLWLFNYADSLSRGRPIILNYQHTPSEDGVSSFPSGNRALAMAEAAVFAGSWALELDDWLRLGLLERDPLALREWETLAKVQDFFVRHSQYLFLPSLVNVAVVVEGTGEMSEIMNLLARRGVQYHVLQKADLAQVSLAAYNLVAAVNLTPFLPDETRMLSNYVGAGGIAVVNSPNLPEIASRVGAPHSDPTEEFRDYPMGKGIWRVYGDVISDPDKFANDVRAAVSFNHRWIRIWNAPTVLARTAQATNSKQRIVHLINYANEPLDDLQVQVKGNFERVQVLGPDDAPTRFSKSPSITLTCRSGITEFVLPRLGTYALVVLDSGPS